MKGLEVGFTFNAERAIFWLYLNRKSYASHLPFEVVENEHQESVFVELLSAAMILNTRTTDNSFDFHFSDRGLAEAARMHSGYRASLAQRRILEWLYSTKRPTNLGEILNTPYIEDFSGDLTIREIEETAEDLVSHELIKCMSSWQNSFLHPEITPEGRRVLRSNMSLDQIMQSGAATTLNINSINHGVIGTQSNGTNYGSVSSHNRIDVSKPSEELIAVTVKELRHIVDQLEGLDEESTEDLLDDLEVVEQKSKRRGIQWTIDSLKAFGAAFAEKAGTEAYQQVADVLTQNGLNP